MAQNAIASFDHLVLPSTPQTIQPVTLALSVRAAPQLSLLPEGAGYVHAVTQDAFLPFVGRYERSSDVVELTVQLLDECRYTDEYGRVILDWACVSS